MDIIKQNCSIYKLDTCLVLSIINIESSFKFDSKSTASAIGLMQLKLDTANDMAKRNNERSLTENDLYDIELNIKYGCQYLRYLIDYYDGDITLVLCGYNAGLGNVNKWLNTEQFIENQKLQTKRLQEH